MPLNRNVLADRLVEISAETESLMAQAAPDGSGLDAATRARVDALLAEFDVVNADFQRVEKITHNSNYLTQGRGRQTEPDQPYSQPGQSQGDAPNSRMNRMNSGHALQLSGQQDNAFLLSLQGTQGQLDGWRSAGEFLQVVASGRHDPRLKIYNSANEGVGAEGGFLVPPSIATDVLGGAFVSSEILRRVDAYPVATSELTIVGANTQNHTGGSIAGVKLSWVAEAGQIPDNTAKLQAVHLKMKKAAALMDATSELLEDGINAGRLLTTIMTDSSRAGLEAVLLTGDGVGKPRGVLNDPALIVSPPEASQAADTIMHANLVEMLARLHPSLLKDALWVASPSCLKQLLSIAFPVSNRAATDYVGGQSVAATFDARTGTYSLLDLPLMLSEALPALGDQGDLVLIAPSQYAFGLRRDISIAVDTSQKFDYDMTRFRLTLRVDGMGKWSAPMTLLGGGPTLSWCVALAAR